ncbi:MAG: DUF4317 domain-containing protein [Ruminococcaceae bacterium]|jgi:hypothetical protein|nr:DUF4317 domain-containing protein [Oscillospiraceae bacterium]
MNQKEINELRRRFRADRSSISRIYGCFVNANREIVAHIDSSLGVMKQEEVEVYLGRLKKCLSGTMGRNLIDVEFTTQQVVNSPEHRLLMALRDSHCQDDKARDELYGRIISTLQLEQNNYIILLAADSYDVPYRGSDDEDQPDASAEVFNYFVCVVCPVKEPTADLRFFYDVNEFHVTSGGPIVDNTALGFLFPAFDGRSANIYNALYFARKPDELHEELIGAVFRTEPPMSAPSQRSAFHTALSDALESECSYEVVQAVNEQLRGRIAEHKESKNPEKLTLSTQEVETILRDEGVSEPRVEAFARSVESEFGETLLPTNLVDGRFEITTPEVKITMSPEYSENIETRVLNGRKYILIPADDGIEVNGVAVSIRSDR